MASKKDTPQDKESSEASGHKEEDESDGAVGYLQQVLDKLKLFTGTASEKEAASVDETEKPEQLLEEVTFEGVANYIKNGKCSKIVVMTGAGISTAAGIPDFRSAGTGLYDNLEKYNLPNPQAVFEINFFKSNPNPFYTVAKELYPGKFLPTITHYFIRMLNDKGLLLRNYTQNIDTLERVAGLPENALIEAHGSFHTARCLDCGKEYPHEWVKNEIFADKVPYCPECNGIVKPDIVFFGESLPERFHKCVKKDMSDCDLLIVMGTSLVVQPFASLVDRVPETTPRLLINMEKCGQEVDFFAMLMGRKSGFQFDHAENYRDVMWQGTTDDGCVALANLLGWKDELLKLHKLEHKRINEAAKMTKDAGPTKVKSNSA
ncbi:NAD-dependent protein deacetylase sirtuin-2-like [Acropora millepora]|uniref:NAD-dependent protein deacetylase sirtuin-2-like n=1 Tax=Acropora millepora TaxID=45264 RepID=UPI0010FCC680|nr:NAD-dependent protein deacetylase sirtuin-2-like [Acropora millepora]